LGSIFAKAGFSFLTICASFFMTGASFLSGCGSFFTCDTSFLTRAGFGSGAGLAG